MGLGMPEVVLILVIALIVFGPRKLPELGKSLGQAMSQFRKASDDFKRTWEQEVESEKTRRDFSGDYQYSGVTNDSSSYDYNSPGSNDPYNPYAADQNSGDSDPAQLPEAGKDNAVVKEQVAEPVAATSETAKTQNRQHWI
jgi:TatA/E family protein of Tat protein translocase